MTLPVRKTWKLFVGGKFPRSESGRSYQPASNPSRNVTRASRKDVRDAVAAARAGTKAWSAATPYLRGQVLHRLAELIETHRDALHAELRLGGVSAAAATREIDVSVDLTVWYAGLADKVQSLLGSQNPVSGPFFVFSTVEPTGVVGIVAPQQPSLAGLLALCLPVLVGGNGIVAAVSESAPFCPLSFAELLGVSDMPAGTVNLLAGHRAELLPALAAHRDVDGLLVAGKPDPAVAQAASDHVARVRFADLALAAWLDPRKLQSLLWVEPFVETKTLWHPVAP